MVNNPFWHIIDFVLASYTFGFDVDNRPREGRPKTFEDADVIHYELLKPNEAISCAHMMTSKNGLIRG